MPAQSFANYCADKLNTHRSSILRYGPPIVAEIGWWIWALQDTETRLGRFTEPTPFVGQYYYMSITMIFGSFVAGSTSLGGGAVAFPVMTLLLGVPPLLARDFSFGIQSFGMTVASITIFGLKVPLDYGALIWATVGGTLGLAIGLACIAPYLLPAYSKLLFVSVWMTFAVALFKLNSVGRDRRVYMNALQSDKALREDKTLRTPDVSVEEKSDDGDEELAIESQVATPSGPESNKPETDPNAPNEMERTQKRNRAIVLLCTGFFGGICSSIAGSGLDIASFSVLTLYYRVSEKVATPTSVVLMGINTVFGVFCRTAIGLGGPYGPGEKEAVWNFVSVCVPIVVIGAPLGATVAARLPRHWLAYLVYFFSFVQFVSAIAIVQPWSKPAPHNVWLCVVSAIALVFGTGFFFLVARWGENRGKCEVLPKAVESIETTDSSEENVSNGSSK